MADGSPILKINMLEPIGVAAQRQAEPPKVHFVAFADQSYLEERERAWQRQPKVLAVGLCTATIEEVKDEESDGDEGDDESEAKDSGTASYEEYRAAQVNAAERTTRPRSANRKEKAAEQATAVPRRRGKGVAPAKPRARRKAREETPEDPDDELPDIAPFDPPPPDAENSDVDMDDMEIQIQNAPVPQRVKPVSKNADEAAGPSERREDGAATSKETKKERQQRVSEIQELVELDAVLDRVLLEELGVRQGLTLEQEALRVRGGRAWGSRELRLDLCHGVGGLDGERVGLDGLRGLERHADRS